MQECAENVWARSEPFMETGLPGGGSAPPTADNLSSKNKSTPQLLSQELNSPAPPRRRIRSALVTLGRLSTWIVLTPPRRGLERWTRMRPAQQLVLGFASYAVVGTALLCLPFAQQSPARIVDHLFNVTSAISTTGLTTISVRDSYTFFGEFVLLALFQLGGIGYMTLSSLMILARGGRISDTRLGILKAGFAVPHYFVMQRFIVHVVVFTFVAESIGALLLWWRFAALGVQEPLWFAVFHSVSAFATAGFGLANNSLEAFRGDWAINLIIGVLCYLGAIGFIVVQDIYLSIKLREHLITYTSKVILWMTAVIFVVGTAAMYFIEPSVRDLPAAEGLLACAFQVMSASSTAGFNSIPISPLTTATLLIIMAAMVIGASPSGTGGGIKTTSVSALLANLISVLRGRDRVIWLRNEVPTLRVLFAVASATLYLCLLAMGVTILSLTEKQPFLDLSFEAVSAIGTVGLSTGITGSLSTAGKLVVTFLMFAGRCGPLTLGLALLRPDEPSTDELPGHDDLAV